MKLELFMLLQTLTPTKIVIGVLSFVGWIVFGVITQGMVN
jgi:hypothetical protein